jgi:hypothetical protein
LGTVKALEGYESLENYQKQVDAIRNTERKLRKV